jgi:hypothetical protein
MDKGGRYGNDLEWKGDSVARVNSSTEGLCCVDILSDLEVSIVLAMTPNVCHADHH